MIDFSVVTVSDPYTYAFTYGRVSSINAGVETVSNAGTTFTSASIPAQTQGVKTSQLAFGTLDFQRDSLQFLVFESSSMNVPVFGNGVLKLWEVPVEVPNQFWS